MVGHCDGPCRRVAAKLDRPVWRAGAVGAGCNCVVAVGAAMCPTGGYRGTVTSATIAVPCTPAALITSAVRADASATPAVGAAAPTRGAAAASAVGTTTATRGASAA
jgi:hypothetical protein